MTITAIARDVALFFAGIVVLYLSLLGPWVIYVGLSGVGMHPDYVWNPSGYAHHAVITGFGVVLTALWCWAGRYIVRQIWKEFTA